jgi:pyruvate dehydrogenase E2 component (dihydrolipoyllysine-residue acetyltransferase)
MPDLSSDVATITKWYKNIGDTVVEGDILCDIETADAIIEFKSQFDGLLMDIRCPAGSEDVSPGKTIGTLHRTVENIESSSTDNTEPLSSDSKTSADSARSFSTSTNIGRMEIPQPGIQMQQRAFASAAAVSSWRKQVLSPAVGHLVGLHNILPSSIKGTGPGGMLLKKDVVRAIAEKSFQTAPEKPATASTATSTTTGQSAAAPSVSRPAGRRQRTYEDIPATNMRKVIAKRLLQSKQNVPHAYCTAQCNVDRLLTMRANLKAQRGSAPSVNDFFIRAAALALREVPEVNALWDEATQSVVIKDTVDISVAVATESGLITPIVKSADRKTLDSIGSNIRELAGRARENKLLPEEFQGGTFSISNLGMFGIDHFSAVINPPQACILAVGGSVSKVNASDDSSLSTSTTVTITMSSDERVVDGQLGAMFLQVLQRYLENPIRMLE